MEAAVKSRPLIHRLLDILRESELPIGTPDLCWIAAHGLTCPRTRVWCEMLKLERAGIVVRVSRSKGRGGSKWAMRRSA